MSAIKGKPNYKRRTGYYTKCDFCNKKIYQPKSQYEKAKNHFCSLKCANDFQKKKKIEFICRTCGKKFYRSPSWLNGTKKGYYCSINCRNKDEKWKLKSYTKANMVQQNKKGLNRLEQEGNSILEEIGVDFISQKLIAGKFLVDIYIPVKNIVIQWDGNYWHGKGLKYEEMDYRQQKRHNLDKSQDKYMKKMGIKVLRFWEDEVYKKRSEVIENIKRAIQ